MINLNSIRNYFPAAVRENAAFDKHILKEYMQLLILDFIASTNYADKICFIGGTNLRLVYGIDRFSEDLDFDCKNMDKEEFMRMTDDILSFLKRNDFNVETRDHENPRLTAYRRNFFFPGLLFEMHLTGHRDERFLVKIEAQNQGIAYTPQVTDVKGCGFFFPIRVPPENVLCAMKLSALLSRGKGRDFYDAMFLLSMTEPDYAFLKERAGIGSKDELKKAVAEMLEKTNLHNKSRDFEHLLFNSENCSKILRFKEFINSL